MEITRLLQSGWLSSDRGLPPPDGMELRELEVSLPKIPRLSVWRAHSVIRGVGERESRTGSPGEEYYWNMKERVGGDPTGRV